MLKQLKEEKRDIKDNLGEVEGMLKSPKLITFTISMQAVTAHDKIQYTLCEQTWSIIFVYYGLNTKLTTAILYS